MNEKLRNVHEITSTTDMSFFPSSAMHKQLYSLLCVCTCALKRGKNPALLAEFISRSLGDWKQGARCF